MNTAEDRQAAITPIATSPPVRSIIVDPDRAADYLVRRTLTSNILEHGMVTTVWTKGMDKDKEKSPKADTNSDQTKVKDYSELTGKNMATGSTGTPAQVTGGADSDGKIDTSANGQHSPAGQVGDETFNSNHKDKRPRQIIHPKDRGDTGAISDAINSVYALLYENKDAINSHRDYNEEQFSHLNSRIDSISNRLETVNQRLVDHDNELGILRTGKASKQEIKQLDSKITSLKTELEEKLRRSECEKDRCLNLLEKQDQTIKKLDLELRRAEHERFTLSEKINVFEIRSKQFMFTIENIPETKNEKPVDSVINRLKSDAEVTMTGDHFSSIYRVGKFKPKSKHPRQLRLVVVNEQARELLISCRGKMKPNQDKSNIWINEIHPDTYRRRKSMLRDLVKYINGIGMYKASIEGGGLKLDGKIYTAEHFDKLPDNCHPEKVQTVYTENEGLAFAGQWVYLSNMFNTPFMHEGVQFHSSEQCYQYCKAIAHNKALDAENILLTKDPFVCKSIGDSIDENKEWLEKREDTMYGICKCKFAQNETIHQKLVDTGNLKLYEATTSSVWGTASTLKSKETKEGKGTGENIFGKLLEKLRKEFTDA